MPESCLFRQAPTIYGYDEESRLVGVKYPDDTAALYQLDAVGNRVGERKAVAKLVPALTADAFLAVSPAALTNDVALPLGTPR